MWVDDDNGEMLVVGNNGVSDNGVTRVVGDNGVTRVVGDNGVTRVVGDN